MDNLDIDASTFMYGFYYQSDNLRFKQAQCRSYCVIETSSCVFVSSEVMTSRLLKLLIDHPITSIND